MKSNLSNPKVSRRTVTCIVQRLSSGIAALSLVALLSLSGGARADVPPIEVPSGEIYVYTSPTTYVDVTSEYHEDPLITMNGVQVEIYPNFANDLVYDGNGNVIGFITASG